MSSPIYSVQYGGVSAAVFRKPIGNGKEGIYVNLRRSYRDDDGKWVEGALRPQDLPSAIRALQRSQEFIEETEDEKGE